MAMPALDVSIAHARAQGAGTEQCVQRDEIIKTVGPQLPQQLFHAAGFKLEDAICIGAGEQIEGLLVVEGTDAVNVHGLAVAGFHVALDLGDLGERLQAQEIHLQQARALGLPHGVLHHHLLVAVHAERRERSQVIGRDDNPRRMDPGVAGQALQPRRDIQDVFHGWIGVVQLPQLVGFLEGLGHGDGLAGLLGHELGQVIGPGEILFEDPRHVLDDGFGLELVDGDDVGDAVLAILFGDVINDFLAPVPAEINVHVGHGLALRIEEPLKEQVVLHGVDVGDFHGPGDDAARRRAAARSYGNAHFTGLGDEIPDQQEVTRKAHVEDGVQLEFQAFAVGFLGVFQGVRAPQRTALLHALFETIPSDLDEIAIQRVARGYRERRRGWLPRDGEEINFRGDLQGALQVLRVIRKHRAHFIRSLHVELVRGEAHALLLGLERLGADAQQRVVEIRILVVEVVGIVRRHQGDAQLFGQLHLVGNDLPFLVETLILDLQVEVLAENLPEFQCHALRLIEAVLQDSRLHFAAEAGGERDEPFAVFPQQFLVNARFVVEAFGEAFGDQLAEIGEPHGIFRQQHQVIARVPAAAGVHAVFQAFFGGVLILGVQLAIEAGARRHVDFAAQDGLHRPISILVRGFLTGIEKAHHAEHVAVIRHRHRGHPRCLAFLHEIGDPGESIEQGIFGVQMEVGEGHEPLSRPNAHFCEVHGFQAEEGPIWKIC